MTLIDGRETDPLETVIPCAKGIVADAVVCPSKASDCERAVERSSSVAFQSSDRIAVSGVAGFHVFDGGE